MADTWSWRVATDADLGLSTPAHVTVDATRPSGAVVRYPLPAVTDPDDTGSLPTPRCSPTRGSTFPIGTTRVTCTVRDPDDANSPATTSFAVTVKGAAAQLVDLHRAVRGVGSASRLAHKVARAQSDLASGKVAATCSDLSAFIGQVHVQSSRIASGTARRLIRDARRIRAALGC